MSNAHKQAELKALFMEEAGALHAAMQKSALEWGGGDSKAKSQLLAQLHTLKGSARTVGENALGQWAHDFESWLEAQPGEASGKIGRLLQKALDQLAQRLDTDLASTSAVSSPARASVSERNTAKAVRVSPESLQQLMSANTKSRAHLDGVFAWLERWGSTLPAQAVAEFRQQHVGISRALNLAETVLAGLRTTPIDVLCQRVERSVRQLSERLGKPAQISVESDVKEIDALLWERLQGSLEHLLANALDHGVESQALRRQRGKAELARLRLSCSQEDAQLLISLDDDGRGIDVQRIKKRALAQQMDIQGYSEQQLLQLVLLSGFSTAAELSQTSGRGVGLDSVSRELQSLGGRLELFSQLGVGTRFVLRLPLSLNRSQFMVLTSAGQRFALPLQGVSAQLSPKPDQLAHALSQNPPVLYDASGRYHCFNLSEVLGIEAAKTSPAFALVTQGPEGPVAWLCDDIDTRTVELTVEPLAAGVAAHSAILGLSCIADDVLWILDIDRLWRSAQQCVAGATGV